MIPAASILTITQGSRRMMEQDPHGLMLAVTSICFVFGVLLILYIIYGLSGEWFIRQEKRRAAGKARPRKDTSDGPDEATATAIATALAIYMSESSHERESGIITIERSDRTAWKSSPASVHRRQPLTK